MTEKQTIPDGYRQDHEGRLVPEDKIKPIDRARDELVMELISQALPLSKMLAQFKGKAIGDCRAFVELSLEQYGVKLGGKKGNTELLSFDGRYKIEIKNRPVIGLSEQAEAAKELIDRYLDRVTEGSSGELRKLVMHAFRKDSKGSLSQSRIIGLRSMDIQDEDWQTAMQALTDASFVKTTVTYILVRERVGDTDEWQVVPLSLPAA
ncbi:hypothetical protein GZ78_04140 [Endozoicomonas numazuensis]|uniref:Sulfate transporter n=2 Tax=Endozoicomonas numazuensis TaxID=1137799 RepID=A0A081NL69_9GAMM|nr:hypothetical protein GZ78_04140 [Endozoicomonas numazuensis]